VIILARFVLIPGSETSYDAWSNVAERLKEAGHACCIHGIDEISWENGVDAGLQIFADSIGWAKDTVLVGHSIAGLLLPSVSRLLDAVSEVYLAALIPQAGKTILDRLLMGEEMFYQSWTEEYEQMRRSVNPLVTHRSYLEWHLFHDCPSGTADLYWINSALPLREIYETVFAPPDSTGRCHFIVCTADRTLKPASQRPNAELFPFGRMYEIATGHCPHLAAPTELINLFASLPRDAHR
jgi:pimeloyl-ACP methyl ester carboxylesterase